MSTMVKGACHTAFAAKTGRLLNCQRWLQATHRLRRLQMGEFAGKELRERKRAEDKTVDL
jgi:hypothetical protein